MSHDEHGHAKEPIIMTSGRRMGKGLVIMVVTLAIGAAILIPFFDTMFSNPPPVTQIRQPTPPTEGGRRRRPLKLARRLLQYYKAQPRRELQITIRMQLKSRLTTK